MTGPVNEPRVLLAARLQAAVAAAFGAEHAGVDAMVRRSERADYQADLAMGLAKTLRRSPRQVAEAIVAAADFTGICERVEIAGPGFINLTLNVEFLERETAALARDARLGVPAAVRRERVVIDYSAPNVAKEMRNAGRGTAKSYAWPEIIARNLLPEIDVARVMLQPVPV